jgi:hypothetical protein
MTLTATRSIGIECNQYQARFRGYLKATAIR